MVRDLTALLQLLVLVDMVEKVLVEHMAILELVLLQVMLAPKAAAAVEVMMTVLNQVDMAVKE